MSSPSTELIFKVDGKIIDYVLNPVTIPAKDTKVRCGTKAENNEQPEYYIVDMVTKFPEPDDPANKTTITYELTR